ncbi:MAG: response regulator [Flavobacteriales bacterium]|nr:response regulator [Flavobacteriales bacterium]
MRYFLFLFFCSLVFSFSSFSQSSFETLNVDSLEKIIGSLSDTNQVKTLLKVADETKISEPKKSLILAKKALSISKKSIYKWGESNSLFQVGSYHQVLGDYQESFKTAKQAALIAKEYKMFFTLGKAELLIARNLYQLGKNEEALQAVNQSLSLSKSHNYRLILAKSYKLKSLIFQALGVKDSMNIATQEAITIYRYLEKRDTTSEAMSSIAALYQRIWSNDSALVFYKKVRSFAKEKNKPVLLVQNSLNISTVLRTKGLIQEAVAILEGSIEVISQIDNNSLKQQSYFILGLLNRELGNFDSSLDNFKKALKLAEKSGNKRLQSIFLSCIGGLYFNLEQLGYALNSLNQAEIVNKEIDFKTSISTCTRILSGIHRKMGNYEIAWEYIRKSQEVNSIIKDSIRHFYTSIELGNLFFDQNNFKKAKATFLEAISLSKANKAKDRLQVLVNLAKTSLALKEGKEALSWIEEAIVINNKLDGFVENRVDFYTTYGQVLLSQKNYLASIFQFQTGLNENINSNIPTINRDCFAGLAVAYSKTKNYKKAFYFQQMQMEISDSLSNVGRLRQVLQLQTQYETKQKSQQILAMGKEQDFQVLTVLNQKTKLVQQRQFILLLLLGIFLIVSISLLLFNRYKLRQKNETLLLQAKQLSLERQQEKTNSRLEMAEFRSDFFTNVSHEFRTPLSLILGPLEDLIALEQLEHRIPIERIHNNASQLLSLVNETLDLSQLENGHLPFSPTLLPIGKSVVKVAQAFAPLSETQGVQLIIEDKSNNCELGFDENMLQKVVSNLLSNAFKITSTRGLIHLTIHSPNKSLISISVQDSGIGIDSEHLPFLFDRFYQADSKAKGSGIGLAICKELVELHKGSISVESDKGKGSVFTIKLPLKQEITLVENPYPQVNENGFTSSKINLKNSLSSKTVLIIEDHSQVRQYLKEILQNSYQILLATDGNEGISLAEQHSPDLILSDIMMPHKSGLELTKHLKQHLATSHIPIVLLTAKASLDSKIAGLEVGADDYLVKPFNSQELLQRCHNLMAQREQLRELFDSSYSVSPKKLSKNSLDQSSLENAIRIIENQDDYPDLTVEKLCQELASNRSGVHLKLKALTGKNTTSFIKSIRLRKAAQLIKNSNKNMNEILSLVGFGSRQTFNKAFLEEFKVTPTEFRDEGSPVVLD